MNNYGLSHVRTRGMMVDSMIHIAETRDSGPGTGTLDYDRIARQVGKSVMIHAESHLRFSIYSMYDISDNCMYVHTSGRSDSENARTTLPGTPMLLFASAPVLQYSETTVALYLALQYASAPVLLYCTSTRCKYTIILL